MEQIKAPNSIDNIKGKRTIFIAGSIDNGAAKDWQSEFCEYYKYLNNLVIFNPRREKWNKNLENSYNNKQFREQVEWELNALEKADVIVMYIQAGTKSPISLLEFGMYAKSGKMIVCCEDEFWRQGNVEVTAKYYDVVMVDTLQKLIESAIGMF